MCTFHGNYKFQKKPPLKNPPTPPKSSQNLSKTFKKAVPAISFKLCSQNGTRKIQKYKLPS